MNPALLDTHYWLWLQTGNSEQINAAAREDLLQLQLGKRLYLSAGSVWEVARLVADGYIELGMSSDRFVREATIDGGLSLLPLTTQILI